MVLSLHSARQLSCHVQQAGGTTKLMATWRFSHHTLLCGGVSHLSAGPLGLDGWTRPPYSLEGWALPADSCLPCWVARSR